MEDENTPVVPQPEGGEAPEPSEVPAAPEVAPDASVEVTPPAVEAEQNAEAPAVEAE